MRREALVVLAFVVAAVALGWFLLRPRDQAGPEVGQPFPELTLTDKDTGQPVDLPADMTGKPFAVQFFSYT